MNEEYGPNEPERGGTLVHPRDIAFEDSNVVAEGRATHLIDKVLANTNVRRLGRKGELTKDQVGVAAYAVAITLEECDNRQRTYRVAETGFTFGVLGRLMQGFRPVHIKVAPAESGAEKDQPESAWQRIGWSNAIAVMTAISLAIAIFFAQRHAQSAAAWESTSNAYKAQAEAFNGLVTTANQKRDEYGDKLLQLQRYIGNLEGQSTAQTDQQRAMAQELRKILGKVEDIQKSSQDADANKKGTRN